MISIGLSQRMWTTMKAGCDEAQSACWVSPPS
jgi:hypothetical protein